MLRLISMKIFEGYLGIKWSTEKKFDDVIGEVIQQPYCFIEKENLQKFSSLKWLNRSRQTFTRMTAYP